MRSLCSFDEILIIAYAIHCQKGDMGFNEDRHSFGNLLNDMCHDVEIEPYLRQFSEENFAL